MTHPYTVYYILNLINGCYYIGVHKETPGEDLYYYMGRGKRIKAAIKKYGKENFYKEIIARFKTAEEAFAFESFLIDQHDEYTYNLSAGGDCGPIMIGKDNPMKDPKIAAKNAALRRGQKRPHCSGDNHPKPWLGRKHTEEAKRKNSEAHIGKGRDYILLSPDGKEHFVKSPTLFAKEYFPDNWKNVRVSIMETASGRNKSFMNGWRAVRVNG